MRMWWVGERRGGGEREEREREREGERGEVCGR